MKPIAWIMLSIVFVAIIVATASADCMQQRVVVHHAQRQQVQQHHNQQQQKVVVKKVVEKIFVPNFFVGYGQYANPFVAPVFGHGYGHGYPDPQQDVLQLKLEIERLKVQQLQQLQQQQFQPAPIQQFQQPTPVMPQAQQQSFNAHPGLSVLTAKCSRCHSENTRSKGDGLVLFRDGDLDLSKEMSWKVVQQIITGKMPPAGPLSDGEMKISLEYLVKG